MQVNERERLDNTATQHFHSTVANAARNAEGIKPHRPDEISFNLSFSFSCSNSFKLLIGFVLLLVVAWNLYSRGAEFPNSELRAPSPAAPANPTNRNQ